MLKSNASHNCFLNFVTFIPTSSRKIFCSEEKLSIKIILSKMEGKKIRPGTTRILFGEEESVWHLRITFLQEIVLP